MHKKLKKTNKYVNCTFDFILDRGTILWNIIKFQMLKMAWQS